MKKAWYETDTPQRDLELKILLGDKKDDVPKVMEGKFGPKAAEKMLDGENYQQLITEDVIDGSPNPIKEKFERNTKLLDLSKTPREYIKPLLEQIVKIQNNPVKESIHRYFMDNDLRILLDEMPRIRCLLNTLRF